MICRAPSEILRDNQLVGEVRLKRGTDFIALSVLEEHLHARTETQKRLNVQNGQGTLFRESRERLKNLSLQRTPVGGKILNRETLRLNAVVSKGHSTGTQMKKRMSGRKENGRAMYGKIRTLGTFDASFF